MGRFTALFRHLAPLLAVLALLAGCEQEADVETIELVRQPMQAVRLDLDSIRARDTLRVLTRNSSVTYFLHRGREMGFEYELVKRFADELGVNLKMIAPPSWDDLIPWLLEGKGDMIAAQMTVTARRTGQVSFTAPYNIVHQVVLNRVEDDSICTPAALKGRRVHVRKGSSYYRRLVELNRELGDSILIVPVPEYYETEYIIQLLMDRLVDVTVADENIARMEQTHYDSLRVNCRISDRQDIAWAVRPGADSLLSAANAYIRDIYGSGRSAFYNIIYRRYFDHAGHYGRFKESHESVRYEGRISPYDDILARNAHRYGFPFELVAAQAYQESRFNPRAESWAGAQGLMQLMPRTAEELGVRDPHDIGQNVEAAVRYLRRLYDRFDEDLEDLDRLAFALASYNVGYSHVRDARTLCREDDLDPNRWRGNVEWMLLNLSRRVYYSRVPAGYARGHEAVNYVNSILSRAETYRRLRQSGLPPVVIDEFRQCLRALASR